MQHFTTKAAISLDDFRLANPHPNFLAAPTFPGRAAEQGGEALAPFASPPTADRYRKLQRMRRHHEEMKRLRLLRAET